MSIKLKVLGLGLLAVLATGAFAVMNAAANNEGQFVSEVQHTTIEGVESGTNHRLHLLQDPVTEARYGCEEASYSGTATASPTASIEVAPTYGKCGTTPDNTRSVHPNGCKYKFEVSKGGTNGTASLNCPPGASLVVTHPNCTITVSDEGASGPLNQNLSGLHYTTVTENGKHAITLDVDVTFTTEYHGGICIFTGTHHYGILRGSVTVRGKNTAGEFVHITTE